MRENSYRKMMEQIPVPEELQKRVLKAASQTTKKPNETSVFQKKQGRGILRPAACAALAMVLVLGSVTLQREEPMTESSGDAPRGCTFGLTACAADGLEGANGSLVLGGRSGEEIQHTVLSPEKEQYTDYRFCVRDENIQSLTMTLDQGGLYRIKRGEKAVILEQGAVEEYDEETVYGLWVPPEEWWQGKGDSVLDGATLSVTATFTDGTRQTQTYRLTKQGLASSRNEDGSETLVPVLEGGESEMFGLYLEPESSIWFRWPVEESNTVSLSAPYGERGESNKTWFHSGIDIPGERGLSITAAMGGTVAEAGFDTERGNYLVIDHGSNLTTLYGQCQELLVEQGETVEPGEIVALMGATGMATGPHLHFEVRQGGKAQNPVAYFDSTVRDTLKMG